MKKTFYILISIISLTAISCTNSTAHVENGAYELTCILDKDLGRDSATLFIVEDDYQSLTEGGLRVATPGKAFKWNGHIDGNKTAFLKFDNDTIPFYFVIGPGNTSINIKKYTWNIDGVKENNNYTHFMQKRQALLNAKKQVFKEYLSHAGDSTLTADLEKELVKRDSILSDSLFRYISWRISKGGPVGTIVKERFYYTLPKKYQQSL